MTAQSTEQLSTYPTDTAGANRQASAPNRAARISRQKAAGSTKPPVAYCLVLLFLMICSFSHWAPVYGSTLQLDMHDNLLSLRAEDADLSSILQRLSQTAGIDFRFPNDLEKKITLQLSEVRIETALKRILKGLNYATVYSAAGIDNAARISTVYIYGKQKGGTRTRQSIMSEQLTQHRISDYEKRIRVVKQRLERVAPDSPIGRRYQKEIENYQRLIDRLKLQR